MLLIILVSDTTIIFCRGFAGERLSPQKECAVLLVSFNWAFSLMHLAYEALISMDDNRLFCCLIAGLHHM